MRAMKRTFRNRVLPWWYWRTLANRLARRVLVIAGTPVETATINVAYAGFSVSANRGMEPYAYSVAEGAFPAGIALDGETGAVSGTPTESGSFAGIVIRVTDYAGDTADLPAFTLVVSA